MIWTVICIVLLLGGIGALILSFFIPNPDLNKMPTRVVSGVLLVLAVGLFLWNSLTMVGTRNVGVVTTFGKPTGYLSNGLHVIWPWEDVTELDNSVQTNTYASESFDGQKQGGATDTCVHVRIARQATACVNVSIRWQTRQDHVDYLFRNYHTNGSITDNLVLRDMQQAMNVAFVGYDPLGIDTNGNSTNESLASLSVKVRAALAEDIKTQADDALTIQSVIIPLLHFDPDTQNRLNEIQQQIALTRVAVQQQETAKAQAKANEALAQSVSKDPNVLIAQCLQLTQQAVTKGKANDLPPGWNCFGSSGIGIAVTK